MVCEWCGQSFRPRVRTQRTCSRRCSGLLQYRDQPRRAHKWGKRPPVGSAHRKLRAELLPAAVGRPCPLCGRIMDETSQLDHIVARAQGGATTRGNCRIICEPCNRQRGNVLGGKTAHALTRRHPYGDTPAMVNGGGRFEGLAARPRPADAKSISVRGKEQVALP